MSFLMDYFGATRAMAAAALVAVGGRMLYSSRNRKVTDASTTNGITKSLTVSSEFTFSDELLSTPINKVYLFTFPNSPHVRNISPFALKVESFLRLHKIPFEVIPTFKFSPNKRQMPYIRLNSQEDGPLLADSSFILHFLTRKLELNKTSNLTSEQKATSHAFTRMIEEHTAQIGFYYRYGLHCPSFCSAVIPPTYFSSKGPFKSWLMNKLFPKMMSKGFQKKVKWLNFGRHSDDEKWTLSCQDIKSISDYLGEKQFMFGDVANELDCTLFGHLAQFMYIPIDFPQKKFMERECGNVVGYVERFRELYWKDWDEM